MGKKPNKAQRPVTKEELAKCAPRLVFVLLELTEKEREAKHGEKKSA